MKQENQIYAILTFLQCHPKLHRNDNKYAMPAMHH